jgi:hypothetical protein
VLRAINAREALAVGEQQPGGVRIGLDALSVELQHRAIRRRVLQRTGDRRSQEEQQGEEQRSHGEFGA